MDFSDSTQRIIEQLETIRGNERLVVKIKLSGNFDETTKASKEIINVSKDKNFELELSIVIKQNQYNCY